MADSGRPRRGCFLPFLFVLSVLVNFLLLAYFLWPTTESDEPQVIETHLYGKKTEPNKIAVIRAEGALAEGLDSHILRQIEAAGRDNKVKAVVLRIDSPGGTIGSSEHIYRELTRLRLGKASAIHGLVGQAVGRIDGIDRRVGRLLHRDAGREDPRRTRHFDRFDWRIRRACPTCRS